MNFWSKLKEDIKILCGLIEIFSKLNNYKPLYFIKTTKYSLSEKLANH